MFTQFYCFIETEVGLTEELEPLLHLIPSMHISSQQPRLTPALLHLTSQEASLSPATRHLPPAGIQLPLQPVPAVARPRSARAIRLASPRVVVLASLVAELAWEMEMALARAAVVALVAARNPGPGLGPFQVVLLVVPVRQARLVSKGPGARRRLASSKLVLSAELH